MMPRRMMRSLMMLLCAMAFGALVCESAQAVSDATLRGVRAPADAVWLDSLDLTKMSSGNGVPKAGANTVGLPIMLGGQVFRRGVGTFADSFMMLDLKGEATRFVSVVGVNEAAKGSVVFEVWVDGKKAAGTNLMKAADKPVKLDVDLTGAKTMYLIVDNGGDGTSEDAANWAGALIFMKPGSGAKPEPVTNQGPMEPAPPIAHADPDAYGIHGPRAVGTTPGNDFIFLIPATGKGPLTFDAKNLPEGLKLDSKTGIITGSVKKDGQFKVVVSVRGPKGEAKRNLTIVAGKHKLAQTPPMGWNSWNVWGLSVNDERVRQAADVMVSSGLAAHGFRHVNIDDGWEKGRAADGTIETNEKFPDMKATADYVHSKGLLFGIYSSPGPKTCGRYEGSWQHEAQDANSYAKWGVDYLKYDWCSYGEVVSGRDLATYQKPYVVMRDALDKSGRDVVFSFCQYGMGNVWEWGEKIGGNLWRTTGDINDSWGSMSGIGFSQSSIAKHAGPGHWNDPDMLVVGRVGWGPNVHPTNLTPNEQITHITMWSMLAAPLLLGADMGNLDPFTLDLLTNDDVLDVNQDPLGHQASRVSKDVFLEVWARPLWDGTTAVALFNRFFEKQDITAKWADLGLKGSQPVRDLWQRKDLGVFDDSFKATVPAHGAVMLKIGKPTKSDF